jgi:hypothetical protein
MKRNWILGIGMALGSLGFAGQAFGQFPMRPMPRPIMMYGPQIVAHYLINGITYPVDAQRRVWGRDLMTGQWFPNGTLVTTPYGEFATDENGVTYAAVRVR